VGGCSSSDTPFELDDDALGLPATLKEAHALASRLARETSDRGGRTVVWNGITPENVEPGSICAASIEGEGIDAHVHRQRHYPETAVRAALESAGLRCLEAIGYDDEMNLYRPADEARAAKVLYVAAPADA